MTAFKSGCYFPRVVVLLALWAGPYGAVCGEQVALVEVFLQERDDAVVLQGHVVEGGLDGELPENERDHDLQGDLRLIQSEDEGVGGDSAEGPSQTPWIGVVSVSVEERPVSAGDQESFAASVVSKMKRALVLGASALIILALNQNTVPEMELSEILSKPVIIVQTSENVTRLIGALLRGLHATAKITYKTFLQNNVVRCSAAYLCGCAGVLLFSWCVVCVQGATLTLWSSCGRSRGGLYGEWQGVICTGETISPVQKYLQKLWDTVVLAALILSTGVIVQARWQYQDDQFNDDLELRPRLDLLKRLSVLQTRTYRQAKVRSDTDSCAVCLEQYSNNQCLRVLPCLHEFHKDCVDRWLLLQQTCPLCKRSVLGNFC
ncbi:RING finger protein 215 isoform X1 [Brachyhypopomus gauderio]|uniref:RING finger protein 215 isoform X1 n=1 Tax=Brachyhypopomus gauderio TaxID=698409 RepID=UPI004042DA86